MTSDRGFTKKRPYFEGWYLKQQNGEQTLAMIPAFHRNQKGEPSASLQIITDGQSFEIPYPSRQFDQDRGGRRIQLGDSLFTSRGCVIRAQDQGGTKISGSLRFEGLTLPSYDIMGPFACVPFMQCRHSVFSMQHQVTGTMMVGEKKFRFQRSPGYWEGDRGSSFPKRYLWTQCGDGKSSVMLSIADIPLGPLHFTGCVGFVFTGGREYRIATYLGAKPLLITPKAVVVRQGDLVLKARLFEENAHALKAPVFGKMERTIHESAACVASYCFEKDGKALLRLQSSQASFENAWEA